jgi:hypothetical protein
MLPKMPEEFRRMPDPQQAIEDRALKRSLGDRAQKGIQPACIGSAGSPSRVEPFPIPKRLPAYLNGRS